MPGTSKGTGEKMVGSEQGGEAAMWAACKEALNGVATLLQKVGAARAVTGGDLDVLSVVESQVRATTHMVQMAASATAHPSSPAPTAHGMWRVQPIKIAEFYNMCTGIHYPKQAVLEIMFREMSKHETSLANCNDDLSLSEREHQWRTAKALLNEMRDPYKKLSATERGYDPDGSTPTEVHLLDLERASWMKKGEYCTFIHGVRIEFWGHAQNNAKIMQSVQMAAEYNRGLAGRDDSSEGEAEHPANVGPRRL